MEYVDVWKTNFGKHLRYTYRLVLAMEIYRVLMNEPFVVSSWHNEREWTPDLFNMEWLY